MSSVRCDGGAAAGLPDGRPADPVESLDERAMNAKLAAAQHLDRRLIERPRILELAAPYGVAPVSIPTNRERIRMRKLLLSLAAVVAMGAGISMTGVHAAPVTPSALQPALVDSNTVEDVRWVRRCGHNWRNSRTRCWNVWRPGHYWRWSRRW